MTDYAEGLDADEDILFGKRPSREPIPSDFADLEETKHETEGAALFIAGVAIVAILACGGLWLSLTFGGPL